MSNLYKPFRIVPYSNEEVRGLFLSEVWGIMDYWRNESRAETGRDMMEGAMFSVMAMLDGCNIGIPGFVVAPCPAEDDYDYNYSNGVRSFPSTEDIDTDIGGGLHDHYHYYEDKENRVRRKDNERHLNRVMEVHNVETF